MLVFVHRVECKAIMSVCFSLYREFLLDFSGASTSVELLCPVKLAVMHHRVSSSRRQYYFTNAPEANIFLVSKYESWKF